MSFDISKYCHIGDVVHHTDGETLQYDQPGLNLFFVAKGSCTADSHGTVLDVKKEEIICCKGRITINPKDDCEILGFNISGIIAENILTKLVLHLLPAAFLRHFFHSRLYRLSRILTV